jgi:hypothetical protein
MYLTDVLRLAPTHLEHHHHHHQQQQQQISTLVCAWIDLSCLGRESVNMHILEKLERGRRWKGGTPARETFHFEEMNEKEIRTEGD